MEAELKELIESTLEIPCTLDAGPLVWPSAELQVYLENPECFGDGAPSAIVNYISVELWYKDRISRDDAVNKLVPEIHAKGYTYPTVERFYDTTAKKYRATLKFSK